MFFRNSQRAIMNLKESIDNEIIEMAEKEGKLEHDPRKKKDSSNNQPRRR